MKIKYMLGMVFVLICMQIAVQAQQLFLLAGQSNAVGLGGDSVMSNLNCSKNAFEFDVLTNRVKPLQDPAGQRWKSLEAAMGKGTILPAFTRKMAELMQQDIVVVHAARGGSSCSVKGALNNYGTWDKQGAILGDAIEKTALAISATGIPLTGIIWMQGERDANAIFDGKETSNDYKMALETVIKRYRKAFGRKTPFFIVQTGYQTGRITIGNDSIRLIQTTLATTMKNVYIVYSATNQFLQRNWMHDFVHYNQLGLNDIGEQSALKINTILSKK